MVVVLTVVMALVIVAAFTPVGIWLKEAMVPAAETPQPGVTPAEPPETVEPSEPEKPSPPEEVPSRENMLVYSEDEIQDGMDELINMVNNSGTARIEYASVNLEEDRMLVSVKGEAMGHHVETEDMEVRFEGRTVFAKGKVKAFGFSPTLETEIDITTNDGHPSANITRLKMGGAVIFLRMLGLSKEKMSSMINGAIKSRELKFPVDPKGIRIEDGKLIVEYEQGKET